MRCEHLGQYETNRATAQHNIVYKATKSEEGWRLGFSGGSRTQLSAKVVFDVEHMLERLCVFECDVEGCTRTAVI